MLRRKETHRICRYGADIAIFQFGWVEFRFQKTRVSIGVLSLFRDKHPDRCFGVPRPSINRFGIILKLFIRLHSNSYGSTQGARVVSKNPDSDAKNVKKMTTER